MANLHSIKSWAAEDQPIYKLHTKGPKYLSDVELLAIIIQQGTVHQNAVDIARALLFHTQHDLKKFAQFSVTDIVNLKIKGMGKIKATRILAAIELGSRRIDKKNSFVHIRQGSDVVAHCKNALQFEHREIFMVLYLNQSNRVIHEEVLSEGGITGTIADPRLIFKYAISHNATGIILCHNHPSGQLIPSLMDDRLTEKIKKGALFFDIKLIDHLIVSTEGYYSYAEQSSNW